jgi:hypothetical protein
VMTMCRSHCTDSNHGSRGRGGRLHQYGVIALGEGVIHTQKSSQMAEVCFLISCHSVTAIKFFCEKVEKYTNFGPFQTPFCTIG